MSDIHKNAGTDKPPSAAEIASFLRGGYGSFVIQMPLGKRVEPEEIWIPGLGCWVRADGSYVSADYGRGSRYFGRIDRWRIRRAVAAFRRLEEWLHRALSDGGQP